MAEESVQRRLVAILAADVVGYSRLMEQDEAGTLTHLRTIQEHLINPKIDAHHGRIVKLMGDGLIAEFGSVVDAVACAVSIQKETTARQLGRDRDRRIIFRIGINLGDVVTAGDDLLGDGVNIAARLEQACPPGGVLISGTAYDHLQGKIDLPLNCFGITSSAHEKYARWPNRERVSTGTAPNRPPSDCDPTSPPANGCRARDNPIVANSRQCQRGPWLR